MQQLIHFIQKRKLITGAILVAVSVASQLHYLAQNFPSLSRLISNNYYYLGISIIMLFWVGNYIFIKTYLYAINRKIDAIFLPAIAISIIFILSIISVINPQFAINYRFSANIFSTISSAIVLITIVNEYFFYLIEKYLNTAIAHSSTMFKQGVKREQNLIKIAFLTGSILLFVISAVAKYPLDSALIILISSYLFIPYLAFKNASIFINALNIKSALSQGIYIQNGAVNEYQVTDLIAARPKELLFLAAGLEQDINHPISQAILHEAQKQNVKAAPVYMKEYSSGSGIVGKIQGIKVALGSMEMMKKAGVVVGVLQREKARLEKSGKLVLILGSAKLGDRFNPKPGKVLGIIALHNKTKPLIAKTISQLKKLGINLYLITAASHYTSQAIAKNLGIDSDNVISEISNDGKALMIERLKKSSKKIRRVIAAIGGDSQDIDFLKKADVSILSNNLDQVPDFISVLITNSKFNSIVTAFTVAKNAVKVARINTLIALSYTLCALVGFSFLLYKTDLKNGFVAVLIYLAANLFFWLIVLNSYLWHAFYESKYKRTPA